MAVPSRSQAARLLLELDPPDWFLAHVTTVADVAAFLAARIDRVGLRLDRRLVEAAALLHDVDKLLPAGVAPGLAHGARGAQWLTERGYAELAPAVANHPVTLLTGATAHGPKTLEERLVAYADKRAGQSLISMDRRFAEWRRRHPRYTAGLDRAWTRARRLEVGVCAAAGLEPGEVGRLRWADRAIAKARRAGSSSASRGAAR